MSRVAPISGPASSSKSKVIIVAVLVGFLLGAAIIILAVGLACLNSNFCFLPKSGGDVSKESKSTTSVSMTSLGTRPVEKTTAQIETTTMQPSTQKISTTPAPTRAPVGPGNDYCFLRVGGTCLQPRVSECPFTPSKMVAGCGTTENKCCVSTREKTIDSSTLPPRPNCGQIPSLRFRLTNSWNTIQWPFMVALMKDGKIFCGATIISPTFLLTATACVEDKKLTEISAITGSVNIADLSSTAKTYKVKTIIKHTDFVAATKTNNIALLEMTVSISMDMWRQPACLPVAADQFKTDTDPEYKPDICIMLGWGEDYVASFKKLQATTTLPITIDKCKQLFKTSYKPEYLKYVVPKTACSYIHAHGPGKKDYGGPILCVRNQRYVLYGVMSFGGEKYPGQDNIATVSSDVLQFMDWIRRHVNNLPLNG